MRIGKLYVSAGGTKVKRGPVWIPDGLHLWWGDRGVHLFWHGSRFAGRVIWDRAISSEGAG